MITLPFNIITERMAVGAERTCSDRSSDDRWVCTRPVGHSGDHVGHYDRECACGRWPNLAAPPEPEVIHKCTEGHRLCSQFANGPRAATCRAKHPTVTGWVCSRDTGHTGPHIGCHPMAGTHNKYIWPNEKDPQSRPAEPTVIIIGSW